MSDFATRKAERTKHFNEYVKGWKLEICGACSGSGIYDNHGSPPCGCCDGTGKTRVRPRLRFEALEDYLSKGGTVRKYETKIAGMRDDVV